MKSRKVANQSINQFIYIYIYSHPRTHTQIYIYNTFLTFPSDDCAHLLYFDLRQASLRGFQNAAMSLGKQETTPMLRELRWENCVGGVKEGNGRPPKGAGSPWLRAGPVSVSHERSTMF